jgi:hypothetical protein
MRYNPLDSVLHYNEVIEMHKLFFIILIGLIVSMSACSDEDGESISSPSTPSVEELEAQVIGNCYIVRDALDEYRAHNDGACPIDIYTDTNDLGLTLIDLLPDGHLLENPFTGERTEPVDTIAAEPGQTGYYMRSPFMPFLYYINGIGESSTILELSNLEELEWKVIQNSLAVREAAEMWATLSGGIYPSNVGVSTTPGGYTLTSLLPDGHLLVNPFTGYATEPIDGCAATSGQTGYMPIVQNYLVAGYTITGSGALAGNQIFVWQYCPQFTCIKMYGEVIYCTY